MALLTEPAYLSLPGHELAERATRAVEALADCRACPRDCGVDRLAGKWSACKTGRHAVVSSAFPHFGEEDCLRGWNGSGTIFFAHCNLRCVFCQNFDISQGVRPGTSSGIRTAGEIADAMLALQARGCHNVNFVTPEHVVPQVLEAVAEAVPRGLRIPLVYNTSAYDCLESLEWLDGVVDIYMPDLKLWSRASARRYLKAEDYPDIARQALREMHRQVGALHIDEQGLATRGVLVRHLVMPGLLEETRACLTWLARELGAGTYVNLMDQYRPDGKVRGGAYAEIGRKISTHEWSEACRVAQGLGLRLDVRA
ncbi:MAG: radical SAM protein [Gemmatimonadota bacterium]|jgi:putative pyruvate formate lyase activating enzyme